MASAEKPAKEPADEAKTGDGVDQGASTAEDPEEEIHAEEDRSRSPPRQAEEEDASHGGPVPSPVREEHEQGQDPPHAEPNLLAKSTGESSRHLQRRKRQSRPPPMSQRSKRSCENLPRDLRRSPGCFAHSILMLVQGGSSWWRKRRHWSSSRGWLPIWIPFGNKPM